ncbi:MAG TPA: hypothetical protein VFV95_15610 [Vicinamibacterales bacterium]|nr:hypothetical protein [Vicinamibacterales bacterium]
MNNDDLKDYEGKGMSIEEATRISRFDKAGDHVIDYCHMLDYSEIAKDMLEDFIADLRRRFDEGQASAAVLAQVSTPPTKH